MTVKTVKYRHQIVGVCYGTIIWHDVTEPCVFAMRKGKFPSTHPCAPGATLNASPAGTFGYGPALDAFRARGYRASCFPSGTGIVMNSPVGRTAKRVAADIAECFGWDVDIMRNERGKQVATKTGKPLGKVRAKVEREMRT